jgi:hypothetical protein
MQLVHSNHRITGRLLATLTVLGLIPTFASVPDARQMKQDVGNANARRTPDNSSRSSDNKVNQNPGVFPPGPYAEWSAQWWQWMYAIPAPVNPIIDTTGINCAQGQEGPVWFLAGTFGGAATRICTIPTGVSLFFPIANIIFGAGVGDCETPGINPNSCEDSKVPSPTSARDANVKSVAALGAAAAEAEDNPVGLEADLDDVPFTNLLDYRAKSPVFSVTAPANNVLNFVFGFHDPAGTYQPDVSDGYWLMLKPLSPGYHKLHFKAGDFAEVTYHLTVH